MGAKRRLSLHMCALVMVGCGVGLTVLKEAPILRSLTAATTMMSSDSPSSRASAAKFRQRLATIPGDLNHSGNVGPRIRSRKARRPGDLNHSGNVDSRIRSKKARRRPPKIIIDEFYSVARTDRSGSAIQHMISALAHGYATNTTYKGACYQRNVNPVKLAEKEALIRAVGLHDVLVSACPPSNRTDLILTKEFVPTKRGRLFTPAFISWLRSIAKPRPKAPGGLAVVHIRRGDIDPCQDADKKQRYLPDSYYVELVRRYVPVEMPVVVFSEAHSFEPFTEFDALRADGYNVTLHIDADVVKVWEAIMSATHFAMSRSTFTFVPAVLNVNSTILYPTGNLEQIMMPEWTQVDDDILNRSAVRVDELAEQRCHNYTSFLSRR